MATTNSSANKTHETNNTTVTNGNPEITAETKSLAVTPEFGRANFPEGFLFGTATSAYQVKHTLINCGLIVAEALMLYKQAGALI